ncbi:hypothetical protein M433DRAFT_150472 [Acidomyces richmondensis BFW]|nr:MAG: hypothetical protein FE78DRAFT_83772 [Acidomyces sp. 'richmondensis']KYG49028.1 hypothetical protein M433DRAFT_150472 [Acidomyces richmondensis BFW]
MSAAACLPALKEKLDHDAFLICCYSQHPLVSQLREYLRHLDPAGHCKVVVGIFEASIAISLQSTNVSEKFGIVSTGKQWKGILDAAVGEFLGTKSSKRYAGTETTGLNADELHNTPKTEVDKRIRVAVDQLLLNGAKAICLGCAGMSGMDQTVREACIERLGETEGKLIKVVDGVVGGIIYLEGVLRARI